MEQTTEMEIKISNGRITKAEILDDGICKITIEPLLEKKKVNLIALCEASKLSLDDEFMKHIPVTENEKIFKYSLEEAIKNGLKDFYRLVCDPTLDKEGNLSYEIKGEPTSGKAYKQWRKIAKEFCPERKSRLGKKSEYIAFLGILIKKLIELGYSIDDAWNAICNDSKDLGHYHNNSTSECPIIEPNFSRKVCEFYDLANTYKILSEDNESDVNSFWRAGGSFWDNSNKYPLSTFLNQSGPFKINARSVGWIVFEK